MQHGTRSDCNKTRETNVSGNKHHFSVAPPSVSASFSDVKDKSFMVNWEIENIDKSDIGHFKVEVFESIVNWNQESYKVANFDMIHPTLRDISVWREIKPLTR